MARQAHRSTHEGKRGTEVVGNHPAARVIASLRRSAAIVLVSFPPPAPAPPRRPYCQHPLLRSLPIPRNVFHPSIHPPSSSTIPCPLCDLLSIFLRFNARLATLPLASRSLSLSLSLSLPLFFSSFLPSFLPFFLSFFLSFFFSYLLSCFLSRTNLLLRLPIVSDSSHLPSCI